MSGHEASRGTVVSRHLETLEPDDTVVAAGATRRGGLYLGRYAAVMDAEVADIMLAWNSGARVVALDSHSTDGLTGVRSWIEEALQEGARRVLMWVKSVPE